MYPEEGGSSAPMLDEPGIKSSVRRNLEGLIPLILIIIIVAFLRAQEPIHMLVIGQPSAELEVILDQDRDLVTYRVRDASSLSVSPADQLAQYDAILLDQHLGASMYDKSISRSLGEAIQNYVRTGGKLITIMDSGIYRSGGIYGTGIASDSVGWTSTFGDIIPESIIVI